MATTRGGWPVGTGPTMGVAGEIGDNQIPAKPQSGSLGRGGFGRNLDVGEGILELVSHVLKRTTLSSNPSIGHGFPEDCNRLRLIFRALQSACSYRTPGNTKSKS